MKTNAILEITIPALVTGAATFHTYLHYAMDTTDRGFVTAGVLILAGLTLYPLERVSYEVQTAVSALSTTTKHKVTGHDWIWDVEAVAFDYMALEIAIAGIVLYATYWFISGG